MYGILLAVNSPTTIYFFQRKKAVFQVLKLGLFIRSLL